MIGQECKICGEFKSFNDFRWDNHRKRRRICRVCERKTQRLHQGHLRSLCRDCYQLFWDDELHDDGRCERCHVDYLIATRAKKQHTLPTTYSIEIPSHLIKHTNKIHCRWCNTTKPYHEFTRVNSKEPHRRQKCKECVTNERHRRNKRKRQSPNKTNVEYT